MNQNSDTQISSNEKKLTFDTSLHYSENTKTQSFSPLIGFESTVLEIFLMKLKHHLIKENPKNHISNDQIVNINEFQAIWNNFKDQMMNQLQKLNRTFNKLNFEEEELEVISQRIEEKLEIPITIKKMTLQEEFDNIMKRKINDENSWYLEPRIKIMNIVDPKIIKNSSYMSNLLKYSTELDHIGLGSKRQAVYDLEGPKIAKKIKKKISSINHNSEFNFDLKFTSDEIQIKHENELPEYSIKEEPLPLSLPKEDQIFIDQKIDPELINPLINVDFDWVKLQKVLFCKIHLKNQTYYEYAPIFILKAHPKTIENQLFKEIKEADTDQGKNEKGLEIYDYLNQIKKIWKDKQKKIDFGLLSMLGKARRSILKSAIEERTNYLRKNWAKSIINYVNKRFKEKPEIKLEID